MNKENCDKLCLKKESNYRNLIISDVVGLKFDRAAFFTKLRSELKKRTANQNPKLKYAYLCKGMTAPDLFQMTSNMCTAFDNKLSWIDYVFIYEIDAKTPTGAPMIWMECPMVFSPKSLNTFVYYRLHPWSYHIPCIRSSVSFDTCRSRFNP